MSPTVTTVVPGARTSPASAAFTSTTPSTGDATTVSASCVSISARLAFERAISALRVVISCSRRFNSSAFASAIFTAPRARATCPACALTCSTRGPATTSASRSCTCFSAACALVEAIAVLIELRGGNIVVLVQRLRPIPVLLRALHLARRRVHSGLGVQLFLRPRAVPQFRQARFRARHVGAARLRGPPPGSPAGSPPRSAPAPVAIRWTPIPRPRAPAAPAIDRDPNGRSPAPFSPRRPHPPCARSAARPS